MKRMKRHFHWYFLSMLLLMVSSCDSYEPEASSAESTISQTNPSNPLMQVIVDMGFSKDDIEEWGDHYFVEGDIMISKRSLEAELFQPSAAKTGTEGSNFDMVEHRRSTSLVNWNNTYNINIYIHPALSSTWATAIRAAKDSWNGVPDTKVRFIENINLNADITIYDKSAYTGGPFPPCLLASTDLPSSGKPGKIMYVNQDYPSGCNSPTALNPTPNVMKLNIAHELGHAIGLKHTDESAGVYMPTTPTNDANSVFNSGVTETPWSNNVHFTTTDKIAIQTLYPNSLQAYIMLVNPPVGNYDAEMEIGISGGRAEKVNIQRKLGSNWVYDYDWNCPVNSYTAGQPGTCTLPSYLWSSKVGQQVRIRVQNTKGDHVKYSSAYTII